MQIQCPHCKSRYRLGSEMIDAYGGFVRCGNCNYKFNIHDQVLLEDNHAGLVNAGTRPVQHGLEPKSTSASQEAARNERIEPRLERDEREDELNIRFGQGQNENEIEAVSSEKNRHREPKIDISGESLEDDVSKDFQFPESVDELEKSVVDETNDAFDELTRLLPDQGGSGVETETPDTDSWQESDLEQEQEPVVFDSLQGEELEGKSERLGLINDDAEEDVSEAGFFSILFLMLWRLIQFIFWTVTAVALAYLLFGQLKNKLYPAYKNHSLVQQIRSGACGYLPCDEAKYDVDLFEIVVSRMDEVSEPSRQLDISIFLLNKAEHAQAYPNILLVLKTIDGSTTGQRVIGPQEYLTSYDSLISSKAATAPEEGAMVKPNKLGKILIKLDNPPVNAVGFEARVVK